MTDVLREICDAKREHVAECKRRRPMDSVLDAAKTAASPRGFAARLRRARAERRYGLIAEIKRASPSKGLIRKDFNPERLARQYEAGGATCLSVLTDPPYFQGADDHLSAARGAVDLPVLRKDFTLDPYQVVEARAIGADCILLILAALEDDRARELADRARELGMDVLVEVHDEQELDRALAIDDGLIGINNRNLKTLKTDIETTRRLAPLVPKDRLTVGESGLSSPADLASMEAAGVTTFLIGEALMTQGDVKAATEALLRREAA
ncbi:MAG: indole-3-glycerol phosphate synthase TrpC [Defluviicoccus sp.]|nr:indole-3-glycerol phosphate synthase TrpC [Defluviicoccus sp.]